MLSELQLDLRELLDLVRKVENFDATLAASQLAGKPMNPRRALMSSVSSTNSASSSCATSGPSRSEENRIDRLDRNHVKTSVFISYAWTHDAHRAWVRLLAIQLRFLGYTVQIDSAVDYGSSLSNFMREVAAADRVLMIVDENYVERADNLPNSGVAIENRWIREALTDMPESWLSVLFVDNAQYGLPAWLADKRPKGFDFNSRPDFDQFPGIEQLDDLWRWIEKLPADKEHALSPAVILERRARLERIDAMRDPANYANPALGGRVTFQHDDHPHYSLGHGEYKFNVVFGSRSSDSVYVLVDGGLKAVGLITSPDFDIAAIGTFLRPGRAVTPVVGQRVVLMNEAGALCVVTIDAVQSEINNATYTPASVTFAYEILAGR